MMLEGTFHLGMSRQVVGDRAVLGGKDEQWVGKGCR
jgi:hypothetical protein